MTDTQKPDFHVEHLSRLRGGVIRGILVDVEAKADFGENVYGIQVEIPAAPGKSKQILNAWIMRDPEGNGPGFLDIVEDQHE